MTREETQAALSEVGKAMHEAHGKQPDRLAQLDAHLATVAMVVDHLFDETGKGED